jgi:hypothetical protein
VGIPTLFGWFIVWWVEPTTSGGVGLLIFVSVVFCSTAAAIISKLLVGNDKAAQKGDMTEKPKQEGRGRPE